jgi:hypothetical protein
MRIKKNGKTINLTEADIKKLKNTLLKEQNPDELKKLIDNYALKKNPKELEKLTDVQIKTEIGDQNLTPEQIESIRALIKNAQQGGGSVKPGIIGKIQTPQTSESVIKIKKGGDTFILTENDIKKLNKSLILKEQSGSLFQGDDLCDILCENKLAKVGSKGDGIGQLQNGLHSGRGKAPYNKKYNDKYGGGGMSEKCGTSEDACDDWFDRHTRDAVIEFQQEYFDDTNEHDGVVGPNTLNAMIEVGMIDLKCDCPDQEQGDGVEGPCICLDNLSKEDRDILIKEKILNSLQVKGCFCHKGLERFIDYSSNGEQLYLPRSGRPTDVVRYGGIKVYKNKAQCVQKGCTNLRGTKPGDPGGPGEGQDKSWSVDECMVVKECIKKIWSREGTIAGQHAGGNEWEQLKECLTKKGIYIKREIELKPITKDIPKDLYDKLTQRKF